MIRVLIVDDESQLVEAYKKQLEKEKMQVFTAFCGQEALGLVKKETIDVIVLDIKLPGMSGIDLLRDVKLDESLRSIPVVMFTSSREKSVPN